MRSFARLDDWLPSQDREPQATISIVMPVHNEESLLPRAVPDLYDGLIQAGVPFELILCENGSTDDTPAIADDLAGELANVHVLSSSSPNYGQAIRDGILAARAPYIFVFDVDYYSVRFLGEALKLLRDHDVVIASKLAPGADDRRSAFRRLATRVFSTVNRVLFNTRVRETHGMKAFKRRAIKPIVARTRLGKDLFDTELVIRAERQGLRITEVPVVVEELRPARSSMLRRIPRTLAGLARLRYELWKERFLPRG